VPTEREERAAAREDAHEERAAAREEPAEEEIAPDPELRHLKAMYGAELREALVAALAALAARSRALLRLRFADGVEPAQLGRLYRVRESTASRWVTEALAEVAADASRRLIERLALAPSAAGSIARLVTSELDLGIARLLR